MKYMKLTKQACKALAPKKSIIEHGLEFERMASGEGRWSIDVVVDGRRIHRRIGLESAGVTRDEAEKILEQVKTDARHDRFNLPEKRKTARTLREAAPEYLERLEREGGKNLKIKRRQLKQHIVPALGARPLAEIKTSDIDGYKVLRTKQGAAPATVNRELAVISHILNKALEWEWIASRSAKIVREREADGRISYLTPEQVDRLLQAALEDENDQVHLFCNVALGTSMRKSEVLSIRLEHIDTDRRVIWIPRAKTGAREQPMTAQLGEVLASHVRNAERGQIWLFPSRDSATGHTVNIDKAFRRTVKRAGLDVTEVVRHTLRHTTITHLVQAGVDLPTVQRISGHKTLAMVARYSHQNGAHIQSAMDKLGKRYSPDDDDA